MECDQVPVTWDSTGCFICERKVCGLSTTWWSIQNNRATVIKFYHVTQSIVSVNQIQRWLITHLASFQRLYVIDLLFVTEGVISNLWWGRWRHSTGSYFFNMCVVFNHNYKQQRRCNGTSVERFSVLHLISINNINITKTYNKTLKWRHVAKEEKHSDLLLFMCHCNLYPEWHS